jgi:hypothetical protein
MATLRESDLAPAGGGTTAPPITTADPAVCRQCHERPRLGALSRCKKCIKDAADADRRSRAEAQATVAARAKAPNPEGHKRCRACRVVKPLNAFSPHQRSLDGHRHACKPCVKNGFTTAKPRSAEQRARQKAAAAKPERRARNRQAVRAWSARHPKASHARTVVHRALRKGLITRPACCQIAGCDETRVVAHHDDYDAPLAVLHICRPCHKKLHAGTELDLKSDVPPKLARIPRETKGSMTREEKKARRERVLVPVEEMQERRSKRDAAKAVAGTILDTAILEKEPATQ